MRSASERVRFVSIKSMEVSSYASGCLCSGVKASPKRSSWGERQIEGRIRSLICRMPSSKCRGHECEMDSGSMGESDSASSSMFGAQRRRRQAKRSWFVCSINPLHHGAYAAVVMC
jgi:hypothetical protein